MGIRGLTTYINNRSHLYLENYELHNTNLVIDGNSVASQLYKWHCKAYDCFTGDYDKYAQVVKNFFTQLTDCNITAYVILDGGYEKKKLATVASRMKSKIQTADRLNVLTEGSESVFPLFLREVFVDIILELDIKCAKCKYEGDREIANLAKALNCPVLSFDSDYYIYGCLYIPFNTLELNVKKGKNKLTQPLMTYLYLPSKIYRIKKFLDSFGGLDQSNLPILAVLLGNDYVKRSTFAPFFRNLKIQKCHGIQSDQQKRIKSVIVWLQNETLESAIKTVLSRFKSEKRKVVIKKIDKGMSSYFCENNDLLDFFQIKSIQTNSKKLDLEEIEKRLENNVDIPDEEGLNCEDNQNSEHNTSEDSGSESEHLSEKNEGEKIVKETLESDNYYNNCTRKPQHNPLFLENFRKCLYPSCFMDMLTLKKYYCIPQCEETSLNYSHEISLDLLGIIHKILTNNAKNLLVLTRHKKSIKSFILPECNKLVPSLEDISNSDQLIRKKYILNFLNIDSTLQNHVSKFPKEWHLFLYSTKYASTKAKVDLALLYALLFCFFILNYVDPKIGFYRSTKAFQKKYSTQVENISKNCSSLNNQTNDGFNFSLYECLVFMDKMVSSFQMDPKLQINHRLYEKTLVHSMAQLQSCFLHVKYLNCLLGFPFPNLRMHTIFNGTFVYNMTLNLRKRHDLKTYVNTLLKAIPSINSQIEDVSKDLSYYCKKLDTIEHKKAKRKKKKKRNDQDENSDEEGGALTDTDNDETVDPNNFFSMLSVI